MTELYRIARNSVILLVTAVALLATGQAEADIFRYTDTNGTAVFVDDESRVPQEYRQLITVIEKRQGPARNTPLRIDDNSILVPVQVTYRGVVIDTWFLLDTGATHTGITMDLAKRLGLDMTTAEPEQIRLADGRYVPSLSMLLNSLHVAPKTRYNLLVHILDTQGPPLQFDGWLGMDFLGEFRHKLDLGARSISWFE